MNVFLIKKSLKKTVLKVRGKFRKQSRKKEGGCRILMYHSIGDPADHRLATRVRLEDFTRQMEDIKRSGYSIMTISEVMDYLADLQNNKSIAITFDDGYKDNFTYAAGVLSDFNIKATFFITISLIEAKTPKKWGDGNYRKYMDWEDVINLSKMGHEIGSHMMHHLDLRKIDNAQLLKELLSSKQEIEKRIKKPVKALSYPYGGVNKKVIETAKKVGYISGCSSLRGGNDSSQNPYLLRRTEIDGLDNIDDFRDKLNGIYD